MVTGGSQGALHLDQVVAAALPSFADRGDLQLLIVTGPGRESELAGAAERAGAARVVVVPFLDRMELGYAAADLVVARAGATTISELAVCGLPSILVPYPHATENHQDANARRWCASAPRCSCPTPSSRPTSSRRRCSTLVDDPGRLASMGARATRVGEAGRRGPVRVPGGGGRPHMTERQDRRAATRRRREASRRSTCRRSTAWPAST